MRVSAFISAVLAGMLLLAQPALAFDTAPEISELLKLITKTMLDKII